MSKSEIMSGVDLIPYDQINIMETLREEAIQALGQERWDVIKTFRFQVGQRAVPKIQ